MLWEHLGPDRYRISRLYETVLCAIICFMSSTRFSKEAVVKALDGAETIKEVIQNLGLKVNNGNYRAIHKYTREHGLELPRNGMAVSGKRTARLIRMTDEEYFVDGTSRTGSHLRERLIASGREYVCEGCHIGPEWQGEPLTLQVDHIDGDHFNNLKDNLRFLCPNCHALTTTFGISKTKAQPRARYNYCADCNCRVYKTSIRCRSCAESIKERKTKIDWPDVDVVIRGVREHGYVSYGKRLGVRDNAIRKHLLRNGIDPKTLNVVE